MQSRPRKTVQATKESETRRCSGPGICESRRRMSRLILPPGPWAMGPTRTLGATRSGSGQLAGVLVSLRAARKLELPDVFRPSLGAPDGAISTSPERRSDWSGGRRKAPNAVRRVSRKEDCCQRPFAGVNSGNRTSAERREGREKGQVTYDTTTSGRTPFFPAGARSRDSPGWRAACTPARKIRA